MSLVTRLYYADHLPGELFCIPLKKYHRFFAKKIQDSSGLKHCSWITANVVTGIFAYPLFGVLAAVGLARKFFAIFPIQARNAEVIEDLEYNEEGIKFSNFASTLDNQKSSQAEEIDGLMERQYVLRSADDLQKLRQDINDLTFQFRKIHYFTALGTVGKNWTSGQILVRLRCPMLPDEASASATPTPMPSPTPHIKTIRY